MLSKGSRASVSGELLRFFTYWRQTGRRTDYDLSVLLLDEFHPAGQVSWTNYHHAGVVHSGDVTDATNGATEFIDVPLTVPGHYAVPQVFYSGESFDEVAESMFGYQTRSREQRGAPFDARPGGRVHSCAARVGSRCRWCSPAASVAGRPRGSTCTCGVPSFNRVEQNPSTTADRVRAVMERQYLTVSYLSTGGAPGPR